MVSASDYRRYIREAKEYAKFVFLIQNEPNGVSTAIGTNTASNSRYRGYDYNIVGTSNSITDVIVYEDIVKIANTYQNYCKTNHNILCSRFRIPSIGSITSVSYSGVASLCSVFIRPEEPMIMVQYETAYNQMQRVYADTSTHPYDSIPEITEEVLFQLSLQYTPNELRSYIYGWVFNKMQLQPFTLEFDVPYEYDDLVCAVLLHFDSYKGYPYA